MDKPRQRMTQHSVVFAPNTRVDRVEINADTGVITHYFEGVPVTPASVVTEQVAVRRGKSPDVLARMAGDPGAIALNPSEALSRFDWVVAVDTNSGDSADPRLSVTGCVLYQPAPAIRPGKHEYRLELQWCAAAWDCPDKRENFGWWLAAESILQYAPGKRVALVVDAERSLLPEYNARTRAIARGVLLPDGVEMMYARAGTGGPAQQHMMRVAHVASRMVASHERKNPPPVAPPLETGRAVTTLHWWSSDAVIRLDPGRLERLASDPTATDVDDGA